MLPNHGLQHPCNPFWRSRLGRVHELRVTGVEIPCYDWGVFAVILYFDPSHTKAFACV